MKLSKEELKAKVNEIVTDNEIAIQLLEDIEDSFEVGEVDTTEIDALQEKLTEVQAKLEDLQVKYKERFLKGEEVIEESTEEVEEESDEPRKFEDLIDEEKGEIK